MKTLNLDFTAEEEKEIEKRFKNADVISKLTNFLITSAFLNLCSISFSSSAVKFKFNVFIIFIFLGFFCGGVGFRTPASRSPPPISNLSNLLLFAKLYMYY